MTRLSKKSIRGFSLIEMVVAGALLVLVIYGTGLFLASQRQAADSVRVKDAVSREEDQIRDRILTEISWLSDSISKNQSVTCSGKTIALKVTSVNQATASSCLNLSESTGLQATLIQTTDTMPVLANGNPLPSPGLASDAFKACQTNTTFTPGGTNMSTVSQVVFCMMFTPITASTNDENHASVLQMKPFFAQFTFFKFFPTSTTAAAPVYTFSGGKPSFANPAPVTFTQLGQAISSFTAGKPVWGTTPPPPFINYLYYKFFWASVEVSGPVQKSLAGLDVKSSADY